MALFSFPVIRGMWHSAATIGLMGIKGEFILGVLYQVK
jgi:hypothetical protein